VPRNLELGLLGVAVFLVALLLDYADTRHKLAVELRDPRAASLWSVAMYLLGMLVTWATVDVSGWLCLPGAIGLVVGTHLALRRSARSLPTQRAE
jgi:hypothetical protein